MARMSSDTNVERGGAHSRHHSRSSVYSLKDFHKSGTGTGNPTTAATTTTGISMTPGGGSSVSSPLLAVGGGGDEPVEPGNFHGRTSRSSSRSPSPSPRDSMGSSSRSLSPDGRGIGDARSRRNSWCSKMGMRDKRKGMGTILRNPLFIPLTSAIILLYILLVYLPSSSSSSNSRSSFLSSFGTSGSGDGATKTTKTKAGDFPPRADGKVLLVQGEEHPIPLLMQRAEERWEEMLGKQSRSFAEAVGEYRRRYGMNPPKGFDRWYAFARNVNFNLIDEVDSIHRDLLPLRAYSGKNFRYRARSLRDRRWSPDHDGDTFGWRLVFGGKRSSVRDASQGFDETVVVDGDVGAREGEGVDRTAVGNEADADADLDEGLLSEREPIRDPSWSTDTNRTRNRQSKRSPISSRQDHETAYNPGMEPAVLERLTTLLEPYGVRLEGSLKMHDRARGTLRLLEEFVTGGGLDDWSFDGHFEEVLDEGMLDKDGEWMGLGSEVGGEGEVEMWYTGHDRSQVFLAFEERRRLENLARSGRYDVARIGSKPIANPPSLSSVPWGMSATCPPASSLRQVRPFLTLERTMELALGLNGTEIPPLPEFEGKKGEAKGKGKVVVGSLIEDWAKSMDPCEGPEWSPMHSSATNNYPANGVMVVVNLSPGLHGHFGDIRSIVLEQFDDEVGPDSPWETKINKLVWRGQAAGPLFAHGQPWLSSHRSRLHLIANMTEGHRQVSLASSRPSSTVEAVDVSNGVLNAFLIDAGMTRPRLGCEDPFWPDRGVCEEMWRVYGGWKDWIERGTANSFKYALDVDGIGWSGRFRRLMLSNSVVIKATLFKEFWTDWVVPWKHFIPAQVDYSDLYDILTFFIGSPLPGSEGEGGHDDLAEKIAKEGKSWAETHLRLEDMMVYQARLMLEYARLWSDDREAASYKGNGSDVPEPTWPSSRQSPLQ